MDVKDFCSAMESEMGYWKAKMYDAMRKIDRLETAEKEKMLMNIQDLNMLMDDMAKRVEQLRTECPSDWSPIKKELEQGSRYARQVRGNHGVHRQGFSGFHPRIVRILKATKKGRMRSFGLLPIR